MVIPLVPEAVIFQRFPVRMPDHFFRQWINEHVSIVRTYRAVAAIDLVGVKVEKIDVVPDRAAVAIRFVQAYFPSWQVVPSRSNRRKCAGMLSDELLEVQILTHRMYHQPRLVLVANRLGEL